MLNMGKMSRKGTGTFLRRMANSLFTGMFFAKFRRHLFQLPPLRRFLAWWARKRWRIDGGKVVFATFSGSVGCNPKYIARALAKRCPEIDIVWLMDPAEYRRCGGKVEAGRAVRMWTLRAYREAATACVWVDNAQTFLLNGMPPKREGQFYLNTWHGSLGIKRLDTASDEVRARYRKMQAVDVVLTNSDFEEGVFRESCFPSNALLRFGHPRNDVFFRPCAEKDAMRARVKKALGLAEGVHLALYAPTFREDAFATAAGQLDFGRWANALAARFGGEWTVAVRLHPHDAKAVADGLFSLPHGLLDVSGYDDMQELLVAADVGITDYSSWIFDFLLGDGIGFVYAPDKAEYDRRRGFYYPLEETPFPIAESEDALCANIRNFSAAKYAADKVAFLRVRGCTEDGCASRRTADFLAERLSGRTSMAPTAEPAAARETGGES